MTDNDTCIKGHSYPRDWYEDAVGGLLGRIGSLDDHTMIEVDFRLYGEDIAKPGELTLARIDRERDEASQRLAKIRDIAAWQATMARLDADAAVAPTAMPAAPHGDRGGRGVLRALLRCGPMPDQ